MKRLGTVRVNRETAIWLRSNPIAQFVFRSEAKAGEDLYDVVLESDRFDQVGEESEPPHYALTVQPSMLGFHVTTVGAASTGYILRGDLSSLGGPADTGIIIQT